MKQTILFTLLAALAGTAAAQTSYIGGSIGRGEQKLSSDDLAFSSKEHKFAYKLFGGYNFNQNFGLEAGFADLRKAEASTRGLSVETHPTALYFAATGTLPLNQQFSLIGKAGVAYNHVKVTNSFAGVSDSDKDHRTDAYLSVGASYAVNSNISVVAEYEYFGKPVKEDGDTLKANMISVGVRYAF